MARKGDTDEVGGWLVGVWAGLGLRWFWASLAAQRDAPYQHCATLVHKVRVRIGLRARVRTFTFNMRFADSHPSDSFRTIPVIKQPYFQQRLRIWLSRIHRYALVKPQTCSSKVPYRGPCKSIHKHANIALDTIVRSSSGHDS